MTGPTPAFQPHRANTTVRIHLPDGTERVFRGVFTVVRPEALHIFTLDFLDPADLDDADVLPVISYGLGAGVWWTERDTPDCAPYVITPEEW
jgi:hypothetical protein